MHGMGIASGIKKLFVTYIFPNESLKYPNEN